MIQLLETTVTIKMSRGEAMVLKTLLGMLPSSKPRHEIKVDAATRISDMGWAKLMELYAALDNGL